MDEFETTEPGDRSPHPVEFEFFGSAPEYFRIWIVNLMLSIATLGIYSAWAKVRTERYFAASTRLDGTAFTYLADPLRILFGRVLVLTALGLSSASGFITPMFETITGALVFFGIPWAIVRSLAFRAHNTSWRNIRFAFGGTYGNALHAYLLLPILGILTLGLLYPHAVFRQRQFIVDNAAFGTTRFGFAGKRRDFIRSVISIIFVTVAVGAATVFGAGALIASVGALGADPVLLPFVGIALVSPVYFYVFGAFAAETMNITYNGAQLGEQRLYCAVPRAGLAFIYATNALAILASLGMLIPWAQIRLTRYRIQHMRIEAVGDLGEFAAAQGDDVSTLGSEFGEAFDIDIGL